MKCRKSIILTSAVALLTFSAGRSVADVAPGNPTVKLPPGHPTMEQIDAAAATQAAGTQAPVMGSLAVTFVAGTAGAPIPANEPVTVELYHRNAPLMKYDVKSDAQGKLILSNLPVMPPVQALISVKHGGLLQQIVTPELNISTPTQTLEMKLYETTDTQPQWNVAMQHMILEWDMTKQAVHVIEMISTNTEGDRAWVGQTTPTGRLTMTIPIPPAAEGLEIADGFDEQSTKLVDGKIITGNALFPGRTEFRLSYDLPLKNGAAQFPIGSPAAVDNLIVFAPADGGTLIADGLGTPQVVDAGAGKVRMFQAQDIKAGALESLTITNLFNTGAGAVALNINNPENPLSARNVAAGGAFLLVLVGAGMMLMRKRHLTHK